MIPGRITLILLATAAVALTIIAVPALSESTYHYQAYPPMLPGQEPGSVSGRVAYALTGAAIPYAHVTIVNASNSSLKYASQDADSRGYYHFYPVNVSNGENSYRLIVQTPDKTTSSSTFAIVPGIDIGMDVPIYVQDLLIATPMPQPVIRNLSGTVTDDDTQAGVPGVSVVIVNAINPDFAYNDTITDSQGHYNFTGVQGIIPPGYLLHLEKAGYDSTNSTPFTMDPYPVVLNMTIKQSPALSVLPENNLSLSATAAATPDATGPTATPVLPAEVAATPAPGANTPAGAPGFGTFLALLGGGMAFSYAANLKKRPGR